MPAATSISGLPTSHFKNDEDQWDDHGQVNKKKYNKLQRCKIDKTRCLTDNNPSEAISDVRRRWLPTSFIFDHLDSGRAQYAHVGWDLHLQSPYSLHGLVESQGGAVSTVSLKEDFQFNLKRLL